jgi:hypothetical protein
MLLDIKISNMKKYKNGKKFIKSITVDGKEVHNGADLFYKFEDEQLFIKTQIGKNKIQELIVVIADDDSDKIIDNKKLKIDEEKTSTD